MLTWFRNLFAELKREAALKRETAIPPPPFLASKRYGKIMYGLWYGRLTPDQARQQARKWRFPDAVSEEMITDATRPPSYWSRCHAVAVARWTPSSE